MAPLIWPAFTRTFLHIPAWPTFKFNHWSVSLLGALGSIAIMFLINWVWASIAIIVATILFWGIKREELIVQWGDVLSGYAYQRTRNALLSLEKEKYYSKNWRPSILTLSGLAGSRMHLVKYGNLFASGRGIVSLAHIIKGDLETLNERRLEGEKLIRGFIRDEELTAFPVVVVDDSFADGLKAILQCHGIGGLKPNMLLLGWSDDPEKRDSFSNIISLTKKMKKSCMVLSCKQEESWEHPVGAINIWWTDSKNGAMMLLMAFLLKSNREWRDNSLRILRPVAKKADVENVEHEMRKILQGGRIEAEIVVLPTDYPLDAIKKAMLPSALLFAGFEPADEDQDGILIPFMEQIIDLPGDVILTYNAGDVTLES